MSKRILTRRDFVRAGLVSAMAIVLPNMVFAEGTDERTDYRPIRDQTGKLLDFYFDISGKDKVLRPIYNRIEELPLTALERLNGVDNPKERDEILRDLAERDSELHKQMDKRGPWDDRNVRETFGNWIDFRANVYKSKINAGNYQLAEEEVRGMLESEARINDAIVNSLGIFGRIARVQTNKDFGYRESAFNALLKSYEGS